MCKKYLVPYTGLLLQFFSYSMVLDQHLHVDLAYIYGYLWTTLVKIKKLVLSYKQGSNNILTFRLVLNI